MHVYLLIHYYSKPWTDSLDVIFNSYYEETEGQKKFKTITKKENKKLQEKKNSRSHTGNRTRATAVRAPDPDH